MSEIGGLVTKPIALQKMQDCGHGTEVPAYYLIPTL
jgi:hypothetical protein